MKRKELEKLSNAQLRELQLLLFFQDHIIKDTLKTEKNLKSYNNTTNKEVQYKNEKKRYRIKL